MSDQNEHSIREIVEGIRRLYRAVYTDSYKLSRQFGLTSAQSGVLRNLFKAGALSSAELSRRLYVTPSNMTGIIDRLEKKGLVERQPKAGDRRVLLIALTESGVELSRRLPDPIEKRLIAALAHLEHDTITTFNATMQELLRMIAGTDVPAEILDLPLNGNLNLNPPAAQASAPRPQAHFTREKEEP